MDTRTNGRSSAGRSAAGLTRLRVGGVTRPRPWRESAVGAIAALTLHLLFLSALTLGASASRSAKGQGAAASVAMPSPYEGAVSALIFIDPTMPAGAARFSAPRLQARPPRLEELRVARFARLSAIERPLSGDDDNTRSADAVAVVQADGAERAMLYGRYVNQIVARIDRLWVLPSSPPSGRSVWGTATAATTESRNRESLLPFRCRVQILQARDGAVREVTLLDCDASPEWQQSLVNAIDAASPLPSPPSESVFARSLVLSFTSAGRMR